MRRTAATLRRPCRRLARPRRHRPRGLRGPDLRLVDRSLQGAARSRPPGQPALRSGGGARRRSPEDIMRNLGLAAAVIAFLLGLSGCQEMEKFYADTCTRI